MLAVGIVRATVKHAPRLVLPSHKAPLPARRAGLVCRQFATEYLDPVVPPEQLLHERRKRASFGQYANAPTSPGKGDVEEPPLLRVGVVLGSSKYQFDSGSSVLVRSASRKPGSRWRRSRTRHLEISGQWHRLNPPFACVGSRAKVAARAAPEALLELPHDGDVRPGNVRLLTLLRAAPEQNNQGLAVPAEVDSISRTRVDPVLQSPRPDAFRIGQDAPPMRSSPAVTLIAA